MWGYFVCPASPLIGHKCQVLRLGLCLGEQAERHNSSSRLCSQSLCCSPLIADAVPVRLMKRDLLFLAQRLTAMVRHHREGQSPPTSLRQRRQRSLLRTRHQRQILAEPETHGLRVFISSSRALRPAFILSALSLEGIDQKGSSCRYWPQRRQARSSRESFRRSKLDC